MRRAGIVVTLYPDLDAGSSNTTIQLISGALLKGIGNHPVAFASSMNIFEDAAHPGIATDMLVGRSWATKCTEDIDDDAKAIYIVGEVLVDGLSVGYILRADVLVRVIVIHHDQVASYLSSNSKRGIQLWEDDLRQVIIDRLQIRIEARTDSTIFRIEIREQVVSTNVERHRTDLACM